MSEKKGNNGRIQEKEDHILTITYRRRKEKSVGVWVSDFEWGKSGCEEKRVRGEFQR